MISYYDLKSILRFKCLAREFFKGIDGGIHYLFPKLFTPLYGNLVSMKQYPLSPSIFPSLKSLVTFNLLSTPINLVILKFHMSEIIKYLSFCV